MLKSLAGIKEWVQRIIWENSGIDEIGKRADTKEVVVKIDPRYFRPTEVDKLLGDSSKARKNLDWEPNKNIFKSN